MKEKNILKVLRNYLPGGKQMLACFLVVSLMVASLSGIDVGAAIASNEYLQDEVHRELASPSDSIIEEEIYEEATDSDAQSERPLWEQREGAQIYGVLKRGVDLTKIDMNAKKGRRATVTGEDVTEEIKVTEKKVYFNSKLVWDQALDKEKQPEPPDQLYSDFTFRIDMGWEEKPEKIFKEGDFFTVPIMTSKNLPFKITDRTVWSGTLSIDGIYVADAELNYDGDTLRYRVVFNQNIKYFEELAGYYSYSIKLENIAETVDEKPREFKFDGGYTWEPTIVQTPAKPSDDKITWEWPNVPELSKNQIGMGKGALSLQPTADPPGGHWRVLFVDFLNEAQKVTEGGEYPSYGNVIIEDTLDANQEFANTKLWWGKETLFHFDIPVMLKGTQMAFHYNTSTGTSPVNKVTLDWGGESYYAITSEKFTQYDTEDAVRNTPLSWAIVWENGCQKLIVNCGKMGPLSEGETGLTTDMIERHQNKTGFPVYSNLVLDMDKQIKAWTKDITNLQKDYYSPLESMNRLLDKVDVEVKKSGSDVGTSWQKFRTEVDGYMGSDGKNPPTSTLPIVPQTLEILSENADYKKMKDELQSYATNQKIYKEKRAEYEDRLDALITSLGETKAFYEEMDKQGNKAVYGFAFMYKTNYINLSSDYTSVSNKVKITSDGHVPYVSDVTKDFKHNANISGKFKNGDLVVVKADSGYGYDDNTPLNSKETLQGLKNTEFEVYRKGDPDTLLYFFDKTLNADGAYVYHKAATAQQLPDIRQSIVTNDKGVAILSELPISGSYYLKEVSTPEGYYGGQNEKVEFKVDQTKVAYKVVNNVPRSVTLKKVDADDLAQGLPGATFELFQENDVALSGFQKLRISENNVFAYTGKSTDQVALETQSDGTLTIQGLPPGKYYLKETKAPQDYILSQSRYPFEMQEMLPEFGITKVEIGTVSNVKIKPKEGSVQLKKTDKNTGEGLSGVSFQLYKGLEQKLYSNQTYRTDVYGEIEINHLPIGSYYFKETATLPEYVLDPSPIVFTLDEITVGQAKSLIVTAVNEKKPEPSTEESSSPEPSTEESSSPEPSTEESSSPEPSTEESSSPEPSTEASTSQESTSPQPTTAQPTKPSNPGSGSNSGTSSTVTATSPSKETEGMSQTSAEASQSAEMIPPTPPQPDNPKFINPPGDRGSIVVGPDERYYFIDDSGVPKAVWDVITEEWVIIEAEEVPLGFFDGQAVVMTLELPKTGERPLPWFLLTLFCGGIWLIIYQRRKQEGIN